MLIVLAKYLGVGEIVRAAIVACAVAALAGCTQMRDYYPDSKLVTVDGIEFAVSPALNQPDTYKSIPNDPKQHSLLFINPMTAVRNVKAIELATGCTVYKESVKNGDNVTFAAVDCTTKPAAPTAPQVR